MLVWDHGVIEQLRRRVGTWGKGAKVHFSVTHFSQKQERYLKSAICCTK